MTQVPDAQGPQAPAQPASGMAASPAAPDGVGCPPPSATADVPEVQAARDALAALPDTPVHRHPAIFDEVQRLLTAALDPQGAEAPGAR